MDSPTLASTADGKAKSSGSSSLWTIFMHADATDMLLMGLGFLGSLGDGFSLPVMLFITSKIMNNLGETSKISFAQSSTFIDAVNQVSST